MAASGKPFNQHSARWQREQLQRGMEPERWDNWVNLLNREEVDRESYALGGSATELASEHRINSAVNRLQTSLTDKSARRRNRIYQHVMKMPPKTRRKFEELSQTPEGIEEIKRLAGRPMPPGKSNPWWY